ncbi:uncharacterized protein M421DRAFT_95313 [Didymella exigua CBS 183.55]|uniref:Uncharacterized protein n=1 Tax=Didymella exigua CBS 183.55 TaxID=1150837 RepID=A0A6A5RAG1_9PLEO|nr:uncharacterized protein M421DRAFT_95313 [Didymella exigua CBS 183.55]KAF1924543.1 hypothetical protein M421DRAFT_95313 [Didymella exigua CBS 183.55]
MSTPNDAPEDYFGTNAEWSGVETAYPAGMSWAGSLFPSAPRDPRIFGPPDPLELVPRKSHLSVPSSDSLKTYKAPGPFDEEDSDEGWRKSYYGTQVYTGEEFVKTLQYPTTEEQKRRMRFWDGFESRSVDMRGPRVQDQARPAGGEEHRFPNVLPTRSDSPTAQMGLHDNHSPMNGLSPVPASRSVPALASAPASSPAPVPAQTAHRSSSIDGEYEIDDDSLPDTSQGPQTIKCRNDREQVPDSTPPRTASPLGVDDWGNANLLRLWKHKVIRKKGYEPMLATFTGQTVESLHEVWTKHKKRWSAVGVV